MRVIKLTRWNDPKDIYWINITTISTWIEYPDYTDIYTTGGNRFSVLEKAEEIWEQICGRSLFTS